ncbi:hypothetical protein Tco_0086049 [Tanacetum coccineum]
MITPLPQLTTPPPAPTTVSTATLIPVLPDFSSLFRFDQRVSTLERELSQLKQADHSAQLLESAKSQIPTIVDDLLSTRIGYATQTALQSYTKEFEKKAQEERKLYIDVVEKSVKDIIKDEVKSQLPQILPKEVSEFATPVIQSTINESLENVILAKSSSQPKSTYEAARSLIEFELKKILVDKIEKSKSYQATPKYKELYDGLVKSYNIDKDLFSSYGNVYSLKRDREDEDKDEDPPARSNQGSSKGTKPQPKSSVDKPDGEVAPKSDWFKKPNKPLTPDRAWNTTKSIDFRPPQTWISNIAKAREPPCTFDELMSTPINFSAYVMNHLKIDNLTQEILVGSAFNLLKGSCKSHGYPFDLSKLLPLIEVQGRQVVHADYFYNKNKAAKYDNIEGIEDMVPTLWSPVKWYDYVYLEEVIVRRDDQKLYKFMKGDFSRVNMHDIKDLMLLLWVEDLQLGVESYQKKLNLTKPVTFRFDISKITLYTAYKNPQGIIYLDKYKRNRLIRSDELYKFCDATLTSVRNVLHNIANNLRIEYLPKRRWNNWDRKRSRIMIKAIDQQLFERRLMTNLEKFVGGRKYREDFRLLDRTI